jgi:hypothetical protein
MTPQPIQTLQIMGSCPLNPLFKEDEEPMVDRNRPPSLLQCEMCEYHISTEKSIVNCAYEK